MEATKKISDLTFCTTRKLYTSSRWKMFEPMKVKIGIKLWMIDSRASGAMCAIRRSAWWNVWGLLEASSSG
jgi:hypothetical protein